MINLQFKVIYTFKASNVEYDGQLLSLRMPRPEMNVLTSSGLVKFTLA